MEVKTKSSVEEITITLTPRDFSSVKSLVDLNNKIGAIFNDMIPIKVQAEYGEWCKQQIVQQMEQHMNSDNREEKCEEEETDDGVVKAIKKGKYYNAVFQHISWEHAQQLLTLAKQLNIEFGQIKSE
jgi:hypothetical protein